MLKADLEKQVFGVNGHSLRQNCRANRLFDTNGLLHKNINKNMVS